MERDERYEVNSQGEIVIGKPITLTSNEKKTMIEKMFSRNGWKYTLLQEVTSTHYHIMLENTNLDVSKTFHLYHGNVRKEDPERNREEKKIQLGTGNDPRTHREDAIILGFYVYEKKELDDAVIVAWPIEDEKNYPANPSLRVNMRTDIQVAKNTGYYVDKVTGKNLVVFRPEFIFHYLEGYKELQYSVSSVSHTGENASNGSDGDIGDRGFEEIDFHTGLVSEYHRNRIVFGAPGTGKSFRLKDDCRKMLSGTTGGYERVTFHPDYTFSQFVGTYKPVTDEHSDIKYAFVPGPFMRVYVKALKSGRTDNPQPYVLIIEEINRAKVAAVFGDVFQLLDRDALGVSEYEIEATEDIKKYLAKELGGEPDDYSQIKIPDNMFIWASMNSADQGVFPMDTAFKRRWTFEYLGINENENKIKGRILLGEDDVQEVEWNVLRKAINEKLASEYKVNEDKLMGPFFLPKILLETVSDDDDTIFNTNAFLDTFKNKVLMYLYEDAAKQHKHKLFAGCEDTTKYSAVCDAFDKIGMKIFGDDFEEQYYNPQKGR